MRTKVMISMMALGIAALTACEQSEIDSLSTVETKSTTVSNSTNPVFTTSAADLTQADIDALMLMREEEKMARDIYDYFYAAYGLTVFDKISNSEETHTAAVLSLIEYFGLTDPTPSEAGVFTNEEIQTLYNQLIAAGTSAETALSTGAFIEEYDIADLHQLLTETENVDIIRVYTNLEKGSENHLRAFVSNLENYGITYEPQILSAEEYAAILAETTGKRNGYGGNNNGAGYGQNGGNGTPADADGDGLCDVTGEPIGQNSGSGNHGAGYNQNGGGSNYTDTDGDGLCDTTGEPVGQNTATGNQTAGSQGNGHGRNK